MLKISTIDIDLSEENYQIYYKGIYMKNIRILVFLGLGVMALMQYVQAGDTVTISKSELSKLVREELQKSIAFIDPMRVFEQSDRYKDGLKAIEKELEGRRQQLKTLENTAMKKKSELETMANALSESAKEHKKEEMANLEMQYRIKLQSAQEYAENAEQKLRMETLKEIQEAAEAIAKQENMVLVLGTGVVYGAKTVDLTDKVIARINAAYQAEKKKKAPAEEKKTEAAKATM
jgi:Skp family chaperone for outer membrane proteins